MGRIVTVEFWLRHESTAFHDWKSQRLRCFQELSRAEVASERLKYRQTDRQTNRQAETMTNRETD